MMRPWLAAWIFLGMAPCLMAQTDSAPAQAAGPAVDDRSSFSIVLEDEHGGGRVEGRAGDYQIQMGQHVVATGGVEIKYRDLRLQCETLRIDIPTNTLTAEGAIILDEGPRRLIGDVLEYNLEGRVGRLKNATVYVENEYYFTGDEVAKIDEDTFKIEEGVFTSCEQESPPWSIKMGSAEITANEYARIRNARMRFGKVPVFWVPYLLWPTTTDRSSGFLVPQPGFSTRRGFELGMAYYKTLGRSADTTFEFNLSTQSYFGFGNEIRYRPSENSEGTFEGFIVNDPDIAELIDFTDAGGVIPGLNPELLPDDMRWRAHWLHETKDLWGGFRFVVNINDFSDPTYRQDFERNVGRQTNNFIYSQSYLSRNFGRQSLNILVDQREQLKLTRYELPSGLADILGLSETDQPRQVGQIVETRRQLPEIEYRLRPTRLGPTPIYFNLDSNFHVLSMESNRFGKSTYQRGDLFANLSIPVSTLPWLSVKADVGGRMTHYSNSLNLADKKFYGDESDLGNPDEDEQSLTRQFTDATLEVVGPSFSKIFEKEGQPTGRFAKYKHIIEPRVEYRYRDFFGDLADRADLLNSDGDPTNDVAPRDVTDEIPLFDEIDRYEPLNEARFSLINRILAKPTDPDQGSSFEIASFELSMPYLVDDELALQFDDAGDPIRKGPVRALLRFNPSRDTSLKLDSSYDTTTSQFRALSLSGGFAFGRHKLGGSLSTRWRLNAQDENEVVSNQARLAASIALTERFTFDANVSWDLEPDEGTTNPLQQRYFLKYNGSCYSFQLELRESNFNQIEDRDFRFSITLKNVGTFIDMNGSL